MRLRELELAENHWWWVARRRIVRSLVEAAKPSSCGGLSVLDVGCGSGLLCAELSGCYHVVGVDSSPDAIEWAESAHPALDFVCGEAIQIMDNISGHFDVAVMMDVLEHVDDDGHMLGSIVGKLEDQGVVIITVPANPSLFGPHDLALGHYRRYDLKSIRDLCRRWDLDIRLLSHFNARLYPAMYLLRRTERAFPNLSALWGRGGPPPIFNDLLLRLFEGESRVLGRALDGGGPTYPFGGSLVAVAQRSVG